MFTQMPETIFGCLISEHMLDNEAIIITNAEKFSNTSGYMDDFKYEN